MIVVDSSAVVVALTTLEGIDDLRATLSEEELNAPTLLDFEVVSALRGLTLGGHLTAARGLDALTDYDDLEVLRWQSAPALRRRAFQLRANLSAYDAAYAALAEALECPLATRDSRLARACEKRVEVWLFR
ncbi:MAG: PIN domain-containing protein [Egibacteraceae bacterium]